MGTIAGKYRLPLHRLAAMASTAAHHQRASWRFRQPHRPRSNSASIAAGELRLPAKHFRLPLAVARHAPTAHDYPREFPVGEA